LPVWLQRAGYRTVHIGKYLNGYGADSRGPTYVPPGWSDWNALVDPRAYVMWGYQINHSGALSTYGQFKVEDPALYQTDVLKQIALDAITAAAGKPFFLNFDVVAPHDEMLEGSALSSPMTGPRPAPRHAGVYANTALPHPPNFLEPDLSDKPAFVSQFAAATGHETISQLTSRYRRRLESLRAVDDAVFAIVARLKALNLLDNTYIVFTSDNGWFNGEHGIHSNKFLMYEPSIRVPMYIRGPGLAHGTSDELVANVDLAATFLDLAGASAGRAIDGRSFVPYARDTTLHSKRPILLDAPLEQRLPIAPNSPAVVAVPAMRGLRTRRFVYVEHGTGEKELYDLQNDPYELASVHNKALYYTQRVELHAALMQYQKCAGDTCRMELMAPN
jgi:arylsulfatase A-like enzyme